MSKKKDEEIKEPIQEEAENAVNDYEAPSEEAKEEKVVSKEEEYLNLAQRIQADFDNYRKRNFF